MMLLVLVVIVVAFCAGVAEANRVIAAIHLAANDIHARVRDVHDRIAGLEERVKEKL